jgi:signal transduction histidine kinase/CheY-like chemotaxis protein
LGPGGASWYVSTGSIELRGGSDNRVLRFLKLGDEPMAAIPPRKEASLHGRTSRRVAHRKEPATRKAYVLPNCEAIGHSGTAGPNGDLGHGELTMMEIDPQTRRNDAIPSWDDQRHELECQLRQAQKMEAVGRLAGGVAHDFNNLLTVINGHAELALAFAPTGSPVRESLEEIRTAAERAAALTRQLLAFSRRQVWAPRELDLNEVVVNMDKMLRRLIGEDVDLATALPPALGLVRADPGQIEQIIMNLVLNARDAMPRGGKLTIETSNVELDASFVCRHGPVRTGSYVLLAVSDTGCGMDAETQSHLFEPFFTTKEPDKGTGLGLATVYGIVERSHGYVWVYSEVDQGATFKIYLPRIEPANPAADAHPAAVRSLQGTETVLLVEDEDAVRSLARQVLQMNGYTVLDARLCSDAVRICEEYPEPIHLLVTDVVMPQMSGRELIEHVRPLRPAIRVLYLSGYTDDAIVRHGVLRAGTPFLQKPFTPTTLAHKAREVLDQ